MCCLAFIPHLVGSCLFPHVLTFHFWQCTSQASLINSFSWALQALTCACRACIESFDMPPISQLIYFISLQMQFARAAVLFAVIGLAVGTRLKQCHSFAGGCRTSSQVTSVNCQETACECRATGFYIIAT